MSRYHDHHGAKTGEFIACYPQDSASFENSGNSETSSQGISKFQKLYFIIKTNEIIRIKRTLL